MNPTLKKYLHDLKQYGLQNNIPNVTEAVGQFLNMLITMKRPKVILEIGCANGYSTIWMAEAAKTVGGKVITVDHSAPTFAEAQKNLQEVDLSQVVEFHFGDAREVIPQFSSDLYFDFVFVDGQKANYLAFWNLVRDRLSSSAVLVFDDMLAFPEKTKPFTQAIQTLEGFDQLMIPIDQGDGILLMLKTN